VLRSLGEKSRDNGIVKGYKEGITQIWCKFSVVNVFFLPLNFAGWLARFLIYRKATKTPLSKERAVIL